MEMKNVATYEGFDVYIGNDHGEKLFEVVKTGSEVPSGGYNSLSALSSARNISLETLNLWFLFV